MPRAGKQAEAGPGTAARTCGRSLKGRALQWLSQREHSRAELKRKLLPHALALAETASEELGSSTSTAGARAGLVEEVSPCPSRAADRPAAATAQYPQPESEGEPSAIEKVEAVLDWLEAHRYLSNERFIESRVHARIHRFGNMRIRQELAQHKLALSPEVAQALRDSELDRAKAIRERKFASWPSSPAERLRQARFLAGRGFSVEVIGRVFRRLAQQDENGPEHED